MLEKVYEGLEEGEVGMGVNLVTVMVLRQAVPFELERLKMWLSLMVGQRDTTAIGKPWALSDMQALVEQWSVLGTKAAVRISGSTYIGFADVGLTSVSLVCSTTRC